MHATAFEPRDVGAVRVLWETYAHVDDIPLLIDVATPSSILREQHRISGLRIMGNGPPGVFVIFPNGPRVSLPTDQIVFADDPSGHACSHTMRLDSQWVATVSVDGGAISRYGSRRS